MPIFIDFDIIFSIGPIKIFQFDLRRCYRIARPREHARIVRCFAFINEEKINNNILIDFYECRELSKPPRIHAWIYLDGNLIIPHGVP
jgi:hypothetical protein